MALTAGTRLGPYEIISALGAGGMGEVYRARDTKLNRDVALKILPDAFALDPDRLARFKREAQVLASLNHPNIAAIYGLEEADGVDALVLELVEGPTLADRIERGPIPLDEALPTAKQIAEALEAAHEQGIVHRDLKPANIKLRLDGTVKVLDFGLAKAFEPAGGAGASATMSPTLSIRATQAGIILGTAAYMSPEQARGKAVDKRTDIWAFGCVLYELVTGKRVFEGDDISTTLAAVLTSDPMWSALPTATPAAVRRLLRACLEKDPRMRLQAIGDARVEIDRQLSGTREEPALPSSGVGVSAQRNLGWASLAGALGALIGAGAILAGWAPWRSGPTVAPVRLEATIGVDASIVNIGASLAVSPDGSTLVFAAVPLGQSTQQLYVRHLEDLRATPLAGTTMGRNPFFSPNGQWIGFFADGQLKKIPVTGGAAMVLCPAADDRGGAWAEDDSILFQPASGSSGVGLLRVSSNGGTPISFTTLSAGEVTHRWPQVLPGGHALLYTAHSAITAFDDATLVVQPLPNGTPKIVQRGGYYGRYLRSGHLVYVHDGTLFAAPFDLTRLETTGPSVPAIVGLSTYPGGGGYGAGGGGAGSAQIAFTDSGSAVYLANRRVADEAPIQWMDRTGKLTPLRATPILWNNLAFSPDGRRLALDIVTGQTSVYIYEWQRDALTRLTSDASRTADQRPVWTPDGQRIVFRSVRDVTTFNLYWQRADGSSDVQRLTLSLDPQVPGSWHPNGKFLAFQQVRGKTGNDLMILPIDGDETSGWKPGTPWAFLSTPAAELEPMFSPDGHWIAYYSNESGRFEVYVRPFPGPGGKYTISTDGGTYPVWSQARHEIVYQSPENRLMVASYRVEGDAFAADKPRVWADRRFKLRPGFRSFDLHPDGERVALAAVPEGESVVKQDKLVFVFNLFDELRRVAPGSSR